jgi:ligand-binding sensor protein
MLLRLLTLVKFEAERGLTNYNLPVSIANNRSGFLHHSFYICSKIIGHEIVTFVRDIDWF